MVETEHFSVEEHVIPASYVRDYPRALANGQSDDLYLAIKQYTPKKKPATAVKSFTVVAAAGCGLTKELYEPLWDELYMQCSTSDLEIAEIWVVDPVWQGQSAVLNEALLGNDPSWYDHSRDLLHMINVFRKQMPLPLVGIAHSMGGIALTNAALMHPRLFASLVLIDPVISSRGGRVTFSSSGTGSNYGAAWASSYRRDIWPSREFAENAFKKSPAHKTWDARVFNLWMEYGLRDLPTILFPASSDEPAEASPEVTLTTPKAQEVWASLRPNYDGQGVAGKALTDREAYPDVDVEHGTDGPLYRPEVRRTYQRLPFLRPPTYFILAELSMLGSPEVQYSMVPLTGTGIGGSGGVKEGKVDHTFVKGVGHMIPMDVPRETAELTFRWLDKTLPSWFEADQALEKSWRSMSKKDKMSLDQDWFKHIGPGPRAKKNKL